MLLYTKYVSNPYIKLLLICEAAEQFIAASQEKATDKDMLVKIAMCLISAEEILDKGRSVVPVGAPFEFIEDVRSVNKRMDAIRSEICNLTSRLDTQTIADMLEARSRNTRLQFIANNYE